MLSSELSGREHDLEGHMPHPSSFRVSFENELAEVVMKKSRTGEAAVV